MPKIGHALTTKLLPLIVFPTITYYALDVIFGHGVHAGTVTKMEAQCTASTPFTLKYTGISALDGSLCTIVAFFTTMLEPQNLPFNVELMTGLTAMATIPYLEAARQNRNILLEFQWIIGIIYQKMTGGVVLPIYWIIFVMTGAATLHHDPQIAAKNSEIDQRMAESIVFAVAVGFVLPTIGMFVLHNNYVTAFWQAFPVWMYLAQQLYRKIRAPSHGSGATTVKFIYFCLFLLSAIPHLYLANFIFISSPNPLATIQNLFVPSVELLDPAVTTFDQGVMDFIKWDYAMMLVGTFVVTLWFAGRSITTAVGLVAWWAFSSVVLGPGASIAGIWWWRENLLLSAAADGGEGDIPGRTDKRLQ